MTANTLSYPQFSYPLELPGSKTQCVGGADRPNCALVCCLAKVGYLKGFATRLTAEQQMDACFKVLETEGVPRDRALLWARALQGEKMGRPADPVVGALTLDEYQMDAVANITSAGGVMALSCGLGKTPAAIKAAIHAAERVGYRRLWICCPINAFPTWRRWQPFLADRFAEVRIISIDSMHKAHPENALGGVVIFDEVHLLGVTKTARTREAHRIRLAFDVGLCLTGTLLHGGIEKTLSMRDLAVPGLAGFANRWEAGSYFNCLVKKALGGRTVTSLARPAGANAQAFYNWMSHGCVSYNRQSEAVRASVTIPDQILHDIHLGEPWQPTHEVASEIALSILEDTGELPDAAKVAHILCRYGAETKIAWLLNAMADNDEPVVVCAEYTDSLDAIEAALKDADLTYVRVDGGVTGKARVEAQRAFQAGEARVFLGQMDAATVSLDLDRACISVGFDHTWKAANYDQFLGRTLRRTQKRECHHFDLACCSLQAKVIDRIRQQMDFDATLAEWSDLKRTVDTLKAAV